MNLKGWHMLLVLLVGYAAGYYFRGLGNATLAKIVPSK